MEPRSLLIAALAMVVAGGFFYAFVYPYLSGEKKAEKRQKALQTPLAVTRVHARMRQDAASRRKQVSDSLKQVEARGRPKASLQTRLLQGGLTWKPVHFWIFSAISAVVVGALVFWMSESLLYAPLGLLIGGWGIPNWFVSFRRKRRINKFIVEFPNAVDVITRGIKAGLPLGDCLRVIAAESEEPVRTEFRQIVEAQTVGLSVPEAVERLGQNVPTAEANFFAIVIAIQSKAGGNLSEALGNLSRVLRDRKKMKLKIKAMSSEAKSSAMIIGCLPPAVASLVYLTAPQYISMLWTTSSGRVVLLCCGLWMGLGILVMRKMTSFEI